MRTAEALRASIEQYLSGTLRLHDFWTTFNFGFADAPDGEFSEEEEDFFAEVDDELHHADSDTPASHPSLRSEAEFRSWLREAYTRFQAAG